MNKILAIAIMILLTGCSVVVRSGSRYSQWKNQEQKLDYPMPTALDNWRR
jgi:uncharacterized protein YceK